MNLRRLVNQLRALFRVDRLDRELDDEIAAHLEMAEADRRCRSPTAIGSCVSGKRPAPA
jgi:hypothetical protein